jgi:hypothetical protein
VSTWSLDRLDALAAEATALFQQRSRLGVAPRELPSQAVGLQPKPNRKASSSSLMSAEQPDTSRRGSPPSSMEFEEPTRVGSRKGSAGRKGKVGQEAGGMEESSKKKRGSRRGPAKSGKPQAASSQDAQLQGFEEHTALQREETKAPRKPALMPKPAKQQRAAVAQRGVKRAAAPRSSAPAAAKGLLSPRQQILGSGASIACSSAAPSCSLGNAAVCQFPMHALTAINDVLYGRHGYQRPELHGDPRQVQVLHIACWVHAPLSITCHATACPYTRMMQPSFVSLLCSKKSLETLGLLHQCHAA